jgi:hypothetical protein
MINIITNPWISRAYPSQFAVCSLYFDVAQNGSPSVIDSFFVNPLTPNVSMNLYYSTDTSTDVPVMQTSNWEQKLWSYSTSILCRQARKYALPNPVVANYIKLEFTNLQPQQYTPGPYALPVIYKKFPSWVTQYFYSLISFDPAIASQVTVQYDALKFLYDHYVDDLQSEPDPYPIFNPTATSPGVLSFVNQKTISEIPLISNIYTVAQQHNTSLSTLLGQYVQAANNLNQSSYVNMTEETFVGPPDISLVSSLNREQTMFELLIPTMFFFLTCRHSYQIVSASFAENRAYFAGLQQVSFFRETYNLQELGDPAQYIETGYDDVNTQEMDFNVSGNYWLTY